MATKSAQLRHFLLHQYVQFSADKPGEAWQKMEKEFGCIKSEYDWAMSPSDDLSSEKFMTIVDLKLGDVIFRCALLRIGRGLLDAWDTLQSAYVYGCNRAAIWMVRVAELNMECSRDNVSIEAWQWLAENSRTLALHHQLEWNSEDDSFLPSPAKIMEANNTGALPTLTQSPLAEHTGATKKSPPMREDKLHRIAVFSQGARELAASLPAGSGKQKEYWQLWADIASEYES